MQPPSLFNLKPHQLTICWYFCISLCICFLGLTYIIVFVLALEIMFVLVFLISVVGHTSSSRAKLERKAGPTEASLIDYLLRFQHTRLPISHSTFLILCFTFFTFLYISNFISFLLIIVIVQRGGSGSSDIMSSQSDVCQVDRLFVTDTITITIGTITKGPSQK